MAGGLQGYEHIEVCARCGARYLEKLPPSSMLPLKVNWVCERCLALELIRDDLESLVVALNQEMRKLPPGLEELGKHAEAMERLLLEAARLADGRGP